MQIVCRQALLVCCAKHQTQAYNQQCNRTDCIYRLRASASHELTNALIRHCDCTLRERLRELVNAWFECAEDLIDHLADRILYVVDWRSVVAAHARACASCLVIVFVRRL